MKIINLDEDVILSLDFFVHYPPPRLNLQKFSLPFVVGSGNAYNTGVIIFSSQAAIFADESNFNQSIKAYLPIIRKKLITQAIIISASGEKDSIWEIELAKKYNLKTTLLTCKKNSSAARLADELFVYQSLDEPYTYNVSTYLGMILSATNENPEEFKKFLVKLKLPKNFSSYQSYSFILPDKYASICPMIDIKKSELFGPHLSIRAFPQGHARHAKFVIPWEKELIISLNAANKYFGLEDHRWEIKLPETTNFAGFLSLSYYLIGKIQQSKPAYFKKNIQQYCLDYGPKAYGKDQAFEVIVPGQKL